MTKTILLLGLLSVILAVIVSFSTAGTAQSDALLGSCPGLVDVALEAAVSSCGDLGRNQACYGHTLIDAQGHDETASFEFTDVGDLADLETIASMELSPLDLNGETWGVSILAVQANLPDTLPGQNVTFVLFGDTYLENQSPAFVKIALQTSQGANVRLTPSEDSRLLGSLAAAQTVNATGRYDQWVRIEYLYQQSQITGWINAAAVAGDLTLLPEVETTSQNLSPMQAFYFTTGIGEITCREAPLDGLLLQTPDGAGMMRFVVNGVEIALGSTAFLQAVPGDQLTIHLLEGEAIVKAHGVTQRLTPGSISAIPLDQDGWAKGSPSLPARSDQCEDILALIAPINLLPRTISSALGACVSPTFTPIPNTPTPTPTMTLESPVTESSPVPSATPTLTPTPTPCGCPRVREKDHAIRENAVTMGGE
jgi:hypothetical protein